MKKIRGKRDDNVRIMRVGRNDGKSTTYAVKRGIVGQRTAKYRDSLKTIVSSR